MSTEVLAYVIRLLLELQDEVSKQVVRIVPDNVLVEPITGEINVSIFFQTQNYDSPNSFKICNRN